MNSSVLCIFALFVLPSVLAISCYQCTPNPSTGIFCTGGVNITNCDTLPGAAQAKFDACGITSFEMAMGEENKTVNTMNCGIKSMCETMKQQACNQTIPGVTIKKCESKCCFEDKCNGIGAGSTVPAVVVPTTTAPTSKGCTSVSSFFATFMSATVLFAKFFIN